MNANDLENGNSSRSSSSVLHLSPFDDCDVWAAYTNYGRKQFYRTANAGEEKKILSFRSHFAKSNCMIQQKKKEAIPVISLMPVFDEQMRECVGIKCRQKVNSHDFKDETTVSSVLFFRTHQQIKCMKKGLEAMRSFHTHNQKKLHPFIGTKR